MNAVWKFLTSLKLTVVCLAIGIVLVFLGTLAQVNEGLYNAQARWFRAFFIWWGPQGSALRVPVFPGGYLVGIVLLLNLVAAHIKRFSWSWKKLGIHLTHFGIIVLLLGQLLTDMLARETVLQFREGEKKNYTEDQRSYELVFATDAANGQEKVISFPEWRVAQGGELLHPELPFNVKLQQYHINSEWDTRDEVVQASTQLANAMATLDSQYALVEGLTAQAERAQQAEGRTTVWRNALKAIGEDGNGDIVEAARRVVADKTKGEKLAAELKSRFRAQMLNAFRGGPKSSPAMRFAAAQIEAGTPITSAEALPAPASQGVGTQIVPMILPEAKDMNTRNLPMAVVEITAGGKSLGTWFLHPLLKPQDIKVGGQTFRAEFRAEREYHPFSLTLLKTTHETYQGTDIPKNFQSRVRIDNPGTGEAREVDIYMNNPLRYGGMAYFQSQMGRQELGAQTVGTSTLQVVKNPSWLTPYLGCILVSLGLLYQFGYHLVGFITKRRGTPEAAAISAPTGSPAPRRRPEMSI